MKDTILLLFGLTSGIVITFAFGRKAQAFLGNLLEKFAAKIEGK